MKFLGLPRDLLFLLSGCESFSRSCIIHRSLISSLCFGTMSTILLACVTTILVKFPLCGLRNKRAQIGGTDNHRLQALSSWQNGQNGSGVVLVANLHGCILQKIYLFAQYEAIVFAFYATANTVYYVLFKLDDTFSHPNLVP